MTEFNWSADDGEDIMMLVYERETAPLIAWMETHIRTHRDMHALMEFLGRMIYKTFPLALTRDVTLSAGEFWALRIGGAPDREAATSARMVVAALNADWDMLTALIVACLKRPEEYHAAVTAHLLAAWGDGLHAITDAKEADDA